MFYLIFFNFFNDLIYYPICVTGVKIASLATYGEGKFHLSPFVINSCMTVSADLLRVEFYGLFKIKKWKSQCHLIRHNIC